MKFEIVTLFPDYFTAALRQSLLGKAMEKEIFEIETVNLRDYATDNHRVVDDHPYGGGGGMVLKVDVLDQCLQATGWQRKGKENPAGIKQVLVLTSASGEMFRQKTAVRYSLCDRLTVICGHYLGIDERVSQLYDLEEISIGDYILTGGEPAAAVIVDATARLLPGVLGNFESAQRDSFMDQPVGPPCYTRPPEYRGLKAPEVLQSGNHAEIKRFQRIEALKKCLAKRPELLENADLSEEEIQFLHRLKQENEVRLK